MVENFDPIVDDEESLHAKRRQKEFEERQNIIRKKIEEEFSAKAKFRNDAVKFIEDFNK